MLLQTLKHSLVPSVSAQAGSQGMESQGLGMTSLQAMASLRGAAPKGWAELGAGSRVINSPRRGKR